MIRLEAQYFHLNRVLLLAIGLWPYQQSKFTRFLFIIISTTLMASVIFQLTPLITLKCTSDLVVKILSSVTFFAMFTIKYNSFGFNIKVVKHLLMQLQHVHTGLKDKNEIDIMKKYDCIGKRYVAALTIILFCGISADIIIQFWSISTDVDLSMNTTRTRHLLIITEYFIDQEKYFYVILLHIHAVIGFGSITLIGIGTMLITYFQHTCGMFRIASYRIEHAMNVNILQNITFKNKILIFENIICAINIHRQAIKLSTHLQSTFEIMLICITACGVICLSLNMVQIFQIASSENDIEEFLLPFVFISATVLFMFISNYIGQNIIDHYNHVFATAYNVQWYRAPLQIQKMILFLLQRGTKEFTLNVGGLFNASIESFAMLVKASVSYFTVIYSTR